MNLVEIRKDDNRGGNFDVLGNGSLVLKKTDSDWWHTDTFEKEGSWTSEWLASSFEEVAVDYLIYGQPQDMATGWTKFEGNPLVAPAGWHNNSALSLALPDSTQAQDQALVRGTGGYEGKWLLLFNVDPWATGGWAAAVADSLAPLKRGENPFRLLDPYPLTTGTGGQNAPNDWIEVDGVWYAPDESRDHISRLWTSQDLIDWTNQGPLEGMVGHDPGLVWDGDRFFLFTEDGNRLQYASSSTPLDTWDPHGVVLDVGDHTGDADVAFFNNAWHMFFDDGEHFYYRLGHAETTPSQFPIGWTMKNDVFGPYTPDQGQLWDNDTEAGNGFGTGDADIAVEGTTLYMTYERPVGIAFKELELTDGSEQSVEIMIDVDHDGDGDPDETRAISAQAGHQTYPLGGDLGRRFRLRIQLQTNNPLESPMIRAVTFR